jgi:hypothetical protein
MKHHDAAALALLGWYLMVPPVINNKAATTVDLLTDAPLGHWEILGSFDSADACTDALMTHREAQDKKEKKWMEEAKNGNRVSR